MAGNRMRLEELENENLRLNGSIENVNRKLEELSEKLLISNQSCSEYQNTIGEFLFMEILRVMKFKINYRMFL